MNKKEVIRRVLLELEDEDEVTVVELLDLRTEQLVERFLDIVNDRYEELASYYGVYEYNDTEDTDDDN
jgi:phage terminase small subunit